IGKAADIEAVDPAARALDFAPALFFDVRLDQLPSGPTSVVVRAPFIFSDDRQDDVAIAPSTQIASNISQQLMELAEFLNFRVGKDYRQILFQSPRGDARAMDCLRIVAVQDLGKRARQATQTLAPGAHELVAAGFRR